MPDQVRDDGVLCFAADVELVDVFGYVGIRYDFRAAGAIADKAADKRSVLEDSSALAFGAMNIDEPRRKRCGDNLWPPSGYIDGLLYRDKTFDIIPREDIHQLLLKLWVNIRHIPVRLAISSLGHSSVQ